MNIVTLFDQIILKTSYVVTECWFKVDISLNAVDVWAVGKTVKSLVSTHHTMVPEHFCDDVLS